MRGQPQDLPPEGKAGGCGRGFPACLSQVVLTPPWLWCRHSEQCFVCSLVYLVLLVLPGKFVLLAQVDILMRLSHLAHHGGTVTCRDAGEGQADRKGSQCRSLGNMAVNHCPVAGRPCKRRGRAWVCLWEASAFSSHPPGPAAISTVPFGKPSCLSDYCPPFPQPLSSAWWERSGSPWPFVVSVVTTEPTFSPCCCCFCCSLFSLHCFSNDSLSLKCLCF